MRKRTGNRKTKWVGVFTPSGNRVAIVGAPTYEAARKKARKKFGGWYLIS